MAPSRGGGGEILWEGGPFAGRDLRGLAITGGPDWSNGPVGAIGGEGM